eukprot:1999841-Alexandrium_andersonii.AAC.1
MPSPLAIAQRVHMPKLKVHGTVDVRSSTVVNGDTRDPGQETWWNEHVVTPIHPCRVMGSASGEGGRRLRQLRASKEVNHPARPNPTVQRRNRLNAGIKVTRNNEWLGWRALDVTHDELNKTIRESLAFDIGISPHPGVHIIHLYRHPNSK